MKIHITKGSGKMQDMRSINTNTTTNQFCIDQYHMECGGHKRICKSCYSYSSLNAYRKNCQPAFQRNSDILASDQPIDIPKLNDLYFRFHSHGELINDDHFIKYCEIADANPQTTFALWTKRVEFVRRNKVYIPDNLILIYSNPIIDQVMKEPPRGFHRVFNNVSKSYGGEANCTGQKCMECLVCYKFDTDKVIIEHVK